MQIKLTKKQHKFIEVLLDMANGDLLNCLDCYAAPFKTELVELRTMFLREGKSDGTSEKDLRVCEVIPRFFDPERNKPLPSKNDITFSDDVFIIDEDGMHGLAYYSFEDCQWKFHTDTLVDYNEVGHETKWKWYYPTFTVKDAF